MLNDSDAGCVSGPDSLVKLTDRRLFETKQFPLPF
jgi:hypothetical protein